MSAAQNTRSLLKTLFPLLVFILLIREAECCTPFSLDQMNGLNGQSGFGAMGVASSKGSFTGNRANGLNTHLGADAANIVPSLNLKPRQAILRASDLTCFDFDVSCRWRNMEGLFVDELDWYQGSGLLDQGRLQVATGTPTVPEGLYAIVATEMVQLPTVKAILVSDRIDCQHGSGELRFLFWTSPEVRIRVCTKKTTSLLPVSEYEQCGTPIERGDPGPAYVTVPDQGNEPFQIYIIAENFVFHAVNLQGGFAIIDNIEYFGEICSVETTTNGFSNNEIVPLQPSFTTAVPSFSPPIPFNFPTLSIRPIETTTMVPLYLPTTTRSNMFFSPMITRRGPLPDTIMAESIDETNEKISKNEVTACEALVCSFDSMQKCIQYALSSSWLVASHPVGNPLTGIRGDASMLPFNKEGSFSYVTGPKSFSRFVTPSFLLDREALFVFSFHKVDRQSKFRVFAKRDDSMEEMLLFEAPTINKDSKRWFREGRPLQQGRYNYIAFEVTNLTSNNYVGIDEFMLVDSGRRPFCHGLR